MYQPEVAIGVCFYIHRIGVTKKIVHVAENFLVRADQEYAQQIVLVFSQVVYRERIAKTVSVDITVYPAIGIAGQITQDGTLVRFLGQPLQWHDRKNLVQGPDIRQRLEYRKVDKKPARQPFAKFGQQTGSQTRCRFQVVAQAHADLSFQLLRPGSLAQIDMTGTESVHGASQG